MNTPVRYVPEIHWIDCPDCDGTKEDCPECGGSGEIFMENENGRHDD